MEQQIHFCTTNDGVRIAYGTVGEGPPLVKAANWLSHLEFDWRSPVWRTLANADRMPASRPILAFLSELMSELMQL